MKYYITILALLITLSAIAQNKNQSTFNIKGHFKNAAKTKVFLENYSDDPSTDSVLTDKAGNFCFKGKLIEPKPFYLRFKGSQDTYKFFLANSFYTLNGDAVNIKETRVKGGREQELFRRYDLLLNKLSAFFLDMQRPLKYVLKQKDTASYLSLINASTITWRDSLSDVQASFIKEHPSSSVSLYIMKYLIGSLKPVSTLDSLMQMVEATPARSYPSALAIRQLINSRLSLKIGAKAPNFTQPDTSGKLISLTDMRGKYVLLDFWASWCAPCRAENPNVLKVYNQFKDKNFTVLSVSIDQDRSSWIKALRIDRLPWTQLSDLKATNTAGKLYAVTAIPANFLIDPNGRIIAVNLRGEQLEAAVSKALAENN